MKRVVISNSQEELPDTALQCQASSPKQTGSIHYHGCSHSLTGPFLPSGDCKCKKATSRANPNYYHWHPAFTQGLCLHSLMWITHVVDHIQETREKVWKMMESKWPPIWRKHLAYPFICIKHTFPTTSTWDQQWDGWTGSWPSPSPASTSECDPGAVSDGAGVYLQLQACSPSPGSTPSKPI